MSRYVEPLSMEKVPSMLLLGVITFPSPQLPWTLLAFSYDTVYKFVKGFFVAHQDGFCYRIFPLSRFVYKA